MDVFDAAFDDARKFRLLDEGVEDKAGKMKEIRESAKSRLSGRSAWWK